jgi:broad specificity phosphatase PhoE
MGKLLIFLVLVFGFVMFQSCDKAESEITTFILLRHAEKVIDGTDDPDLTAEGVERAERVAFMLKATDVDAIYSTNYKRTRNTVAPLAESKNIQVLPYEAHNPDIIDMMVNSHRGKTIVICGHSNNIPWTANLLTGTESLKDFREDDYDNMLIVSVPEKGKMAKVMWLSY